MYDFNKIDLFLIAGNMHYHIMTTLNQAVNKINSTGEMRIADLSCVIPVMNVESVECRRLSAMFAGQCLVCVFTSHMPCSRLWGARARHQYAFIGPIDDTYSESSHATARETLLCHQWVQVNGLFVNSLHTCHQVSPPVALQGYQCPVLDRSPSVKPRLIMSHCSGMPLPHDN